MGWIWTLDVLDQLFGPTNVVCLSNEVKICFTGVHTSDNQEQEKSCHEKNDWSNCKLVQEET